MLLPDLDATKAKVVLAILWSSVARYYLFMTSGTWGPWHDEVLKQTIATIPIRFPTNGAMTNKIVKVVDELRNIPNVAEEQTLLTPDGLPKHERDRQARARGERIRVLEARLDEAVYDLFQLSEDERDRIEELCTLDLDLLYRGMQSSAARPLGWPEGLARFGGRNDLDADEGRQNELCWYLRAFLDLWEPQLEDQDGRLRWRIVRPPEVSSMTAVILETETAANPLPPPENSDEEEWADLLARLDQSTRQPTSSKRVYIDGLVRIVNDSEIAIIKRNERRLWTKSAARDDAEATMVMAMQFAAKLS